MRLRRIVSPEFDGGVSSEISWWYAQPCDKRMSTDQAISTRLYNGGPFLLEGSRNKSGQIFGDRGDR